MKAQIQHKVSVLLDGERLLDQSFSSALSRDAILQRLVSALDPQFRLIKAEPKRIEYQGRAQKLSDWAKEFSLPTNVLRSRICFGWTIERALTTPIQRPRDRAKLYSFGNASHTVWEWAQIMCIPRSAIYYRLRLGLSIEEALKLPRHYHKKSQGFSRREANAIRQEECQQGVHPSTVGPTGVLARAI